MTTTITTTTTTSLGKRFGNSRKTRMMMKIILSLSTLIILPLCQSFHFPNDVPNLSLASSLNKQNVLIPPKSFKPLLPLSTQSRYTQLHAFRSRLSFINDGQSSKSQQKRQSKFGRKLFGSSISSSKNLFWMKTIRFRIQKFLSILLTASILLFGSLSLSTKASHASSLSSSTSPMETRLISTQSSSIASASSNLDKIVQQYVEKHMFDEEKFDPFENAYREAYGDQLSGINPIEQILEQQGLVAEGGSSINNKRDAVSGDSNMGGVGLFYQLNKISKSFNDAIIRWAEANTGLDPKAVRSFLALFNVTVLPFMGLYGILTFAGSFRKGLQWKRLRIFGFKQDLSADEIEEPDENEDDDDDDDDDEE